MSPPAACAIAQRPRESVSERLGCWGHSVGTRLTSTCENECLQNDPLFEQCVDGQCSF